MVAVKGVSVCTFRAFPDAPSAAQDEHGAKLPVRTRDQRGTPLTRGQRIAAQFLSAARISTPIIATAPSLPARGSPGMRELLRGSSALGRRFPALQPPRDPPGSLPKIRWKNQTRAICALGRVGCSSFREHGSKIPVVLPASYLKFQIRNLDYLFPPKERHYKDTHKISAPFEG